MAAKVHGLRPIRLSEIPFGQRMNALRLAVRSAVDAEEATELMLAALFPSEKVYWIREQAAVAEERAAA